MENLGMRDLEHLLCLSDNEGHAFQPCWRHQPDVESQVQSLRRAFVKAWLLCCALAVMLQVLQRASRHDVHES